MTNEFVTELGNNVWEQKPEMGDIVEAFNGRVTGKVVCIDFHHGKGENTIIVEWAEIDGQTRTAAPFESEINAIVAKTKTNWANAMESMAMAKKELMEAFSQSQPILF